LLISVKIYLILIYRFIYDNIILVIIYIKYYKYNNSLITLGDIPTI